MRVLLIKLSSMGDVIHTLPAINDAVQVMPQIKFTWLIEEGFEEIARWHPAVEKVIVTRLRQHKNKQILNTIKQIRRQDYDLVIDAQGLLKSAVFTLLSRTKIRAGYAWGCIKENPASLFYNRKSSVAWGLHAIYRMRKLFADSLGYEMPTTIATYGVDWQNVADLPVVKTNKPYIVFLHGTTWQSKHWPDEYWLELAQIAVQNGYGVRATWANEEQKDRVSNLAKQVPEFVMLPHLNLNQAASVLYQANAVIAVDTGFAHLAAALDKPIVALYGASDVRSAATQGAKCSNLSAKFACSPCNKRVCDYVGLSKVQPACMEQLTPNLVWDQLIKLGCV